MDGYYKRGLQGIINVNGNLHSKLLESPDTPAVAFPRHLLGGFDFLFHIPALSRDSACSSNEMYLSNHSEFTIVYI